VDRALIPFPPPWLPSWDSFGLSDGNRSAETLRVYRTSVADFGQYLITAKGNLPALSAVTKEDVLRYIRELDRAGKAPATQHMRFRSLRTFFGWLVKEHDIEVSPVGGFKAPSSASPRRRCSATPPSSACWRPAAAPTSAHAATWP